MKKQVFIIIIALLLIPAWVFGADRYWVNDDSDGSWNAANNWSASTGGAGGAGVPGSSDAVIFDGNGTDNCLCDVAIDIASLTVVAGYTGDLDLADSAYAHAVSGDVTLDGVGAFDLGDCSLTVGGDWDVQDQDSATWEEGTSTVILTGSSKTLEAKNTRPFYNLTIDTGADIANLNTAIFVTNNFLVTGDFDLSGTQGITVFNLATINGNCTSTGGPHLSCNTADLTVGAAGTITDAYVNFTRGGTISNAGTGWTSGAIIRWGCTINAGTYGGNWQFLQDRAAGDETITINGNLIFTADVLFDNDEGVLRTYTIDNSGNYDLTFQGDVTCSETGGGTLAWTKGTGDITFSGTGAQAIDFNGLAVEDIVISNTGGTVTFSSSFTTDSLVQDENTDVAGAVTITMAGNFVINGSNGKECTWNGPDLAIGGTAVAHYTTATDSDASGGTEVTATDNCVDGGGNTKWDFGASGWAGTANGISNPGKVSGIDKSNIDKVIGV